MVTTVNYVFLVHMVTPPLNKDVRNVTVMVMVMSQKESVILRQGCVSVKIIQWVTAVISVFLDC